VAGLDQRPVRAAVQRSYPTQEPERRTRSDPGWQSAVPRRLNHAAHQRVSPWTWSNRGDGLKCVRRIEPTSLATGTSSWFPPSFAGVRRGCSRPAPGR